MAYHHPAHGTIYCRQDVARTLKAPAREFIMFLHEIAWTTRPGRSREEVHINPQVEARGLICYRDDHRHETRCGSRATQPYPCITGEGISILRDAWRAYQKALKRFPDDRQGAIGAAKRAGIGAFDERKERRGKAA
ncbi:hypothetical protein [Methylocella sp.]|uniref:hypothetical protein n=1 Tax=Methylocella sp. TaxID=1978226 RepID=UPI0035AEE8EB